MTEAVVFAPMMRDVAVKLLGEPNYTSGDTLRWGSRGSLKVDVSEGVWHDHEASVGGGVLALVARELGCNKASAVAWLEAGGFIESREADQKFYDYRDEHGKVLFRVERRPGGGSQRFLQHGPDGAGGFATRKGCMSGVRRVLYRLDALVAAPPDEIVFFTEGEKDCDRLASLGLVATTNPGGAAKFAEVADCIAVHLAGRRVVLLEDNDKVGAHHCVTATNIIGAHAAAVATLRLAGLPAKGDVSDWLNSGGTLAELRELADRLLAAPPDPGRSSRPSAPAGLAFRKGISATALMAKRFSPIRWIVPGYIVEGMTLFAGAPKLGKSWMALGWGYSVASGGPAMGSIACEQGDVLCLMLEDNERRLQRRLRQMQMAKIPDRLTLMTEWPTLADDCVAEIEAWIAGVDNPRLIVVDVFARVKSPKGNRENDYDADYRQASMLQSIASRHNLAIVLIHHTRKMHADDPFDQVSGTRGLTGAADSVLVLNRDPGTKQPVLYGRGRDLEEIETAMAFDMDTGTWSILGAAWQVADTVEQRTIQEVLGRSVDPMTPTEIAALLNQSRQSVQNKLSRMYAEGKVEKATTGRYTLVSHVSDVSPMTSLKDTIETRETQIHAREDEPDYLAGWGSMSERGL